MDGSQEEIHCWRSADLLIMTAYGHGPPRVDAGLNVHVHRVKGLSAITDCGRHLDGMALFDEEWHGEFRCERCWPETPDPAELPGIERPALAAAVELT
ncbi:MAG: hypothetical protein ABSB54_01995 [Acidimicrobiales bacterium]